MPVIDICFLILIGLMLFHGFFKGFIGELFSWASLILAIWVAVILFPAGGAYIRESFMPNIRVVPEVLAFISIFLVILIAIKLLGFLLKNVIEGARLGFVNKILGAVFGVVEGFAIVMIILFVLSVQPLFDASSLIGESAFAQFLAPLINILPERAQEFVNITHLLLPGWKG
jgi:membrane protein required for colicin V production